MIHAYDRLLLYGIDITRERWRLKKARRKARQLGQGATLSAGEWCNALLYWNCRCVYCGAWLEKTRNQNAANALTIDHFRPLTMGGDTSAANCVPACRHCNEGRSDQPIRIWLLDTFTDAEAIYQRIVDYLQFASGNGMR